MRNYIIFLIFIALHGQLIFCGSSYARDFYEIALKLSKNNNSSYEDLQIIHLLRVPKAGISINFFACYFTHIHIHS